MSKNNNLFSYTVYLIITVGIIILTQVLDNYMERYLSETFSINIPLFLLTQMMPIIFGAILRLEYIVHEFRKSGKWELNRKLIVTIGLPSLIVSLVPLLPFLGLSLYNYNLLPVYMIADTKLFQVLLGHTVISSFKKVG